MNQLTIAVDYDGTFTEDPEMWLDFISLAKKSGHRVICITMRYPQEGGPVEAQLGWCVDEIYYTRRRAKIDYCRLNEIHVDIWIDDNPKWLFENSR